MRTFASISLQEYHRSASVLPLCELEVGAWSGVESASHTMAAVLVQLDGETSDESKGKRQEPLLSDSSPCLPRSPVWALRP